jgi:hypothetical protein
VEAVMNEKMIIIWVVGILGASMSFRKVLKILPGIIEALLKKIMPLIIFISLFRNVEFVRDKWPAIKELAAHENIQGILHTVVFYSHKLFQLLIEIILSTADKI